MIHDRIRKATPLLLIFFFSTLFAGFSYFRTFDLYEFQTYDWRCRVKPRPHTSDDIVLIHIGDDALQALGSWPFPRGYHAVLIDALKKYKTKMLGFDILLVESTPGDTALSAAAKEFGGVYFSEAFHAPEYKDKSLTSPKILAPLLGEFREAARGVGHVNAEVDPDGKRRRVPAAIQYKDGTHLHLGIRMAADYLGVKPEEIGYDRKGNLKLGDHATIPLERGQMLVHFAGPWTETFRHVSYVNILAAYRDVMQGGIPQFDLNALEGKVCFLGFTATATVDINPIPLEPIYPQVGVHANAFNQILNKQFIRRVSRLGNLVLLFFLAIIAVVLTRITRLWLSIALAFTTLALYVGGTILCFAFALVWADLFWPSVAYGIIYLAGILRRTMNEKRERELIEAELSIATRIQKSFLPSSLPESQVIDIAAFMEPAKHVGGDLYDAFKIDDDHIGIMLGDVSGKGTPAALFMAKSVSEFKFRSRHNHDAANVLTNLNESLAEDDSAGLFVTMNYAIFNVTRKKMQLSNGGHMPVLKVDKSGKHAYVTPDGGMPLALMPGVEFENLTMPIQSGDVFVMYSDGVSEARNKAQQDFEMERLAKSAIKHRSGSAKDIENGILKDIRKFVGHAPQHDDTTLIVIKIK